MISTIFIIPLVLGMFPVTLQTAQIGLMPDNPMFGLELAIENLQEQLTTDPVQKENLILQHEQNRLNELNALPDNSNPIILQNQEQLILDKLNQAGDAEVAVSDPTTTATIDTQVSGTIDQESAQIDNINSQNNVNSQNNNVNLQQNNLLGTTSAQNTSPTFQDVANSESDIVPTTNNDIQDLSSAGVDTSSTASTTSQLPVTSVTDGSGNIQVPDSSGSQSAPISSPAASASSDSGGN